MTKVKSFVGFKLTDLTGGIDPFFYDHNGEGAFATVNIEGLPGAVLSVYGDFKYSGGGDEPQSGDIDGIELGVFNENGKYIPLGRFEDLPKGVDIGDLIDAVRSDTPLDDLLIFSKIFAGNDEFAGSKKADFFYGFDGSDDLSGGKGDDTLDGGSGKDTIDCGPGGADHVVFSVLEKKYDIVSNFGANDVLDFNGAAFDKLGEVGGHLDETMFVEGKKAVDANDYLIYDQKTGKLFYDADGSGDGKQVLIAKLGKGTELDADDIHLI